MVYYSDHLFTWNHEKHNDLCLKHFGDKGQFWNKRNKVKVEAFLRDYTDDNSLKLERIVQTKNVATGHPIWEFHTK